MGVVVMTRREFAEKAVALVMHPEHEAKTREEFEDMPHVQIVVSDKYNNGGVSVIFKDGVITE